MSKYESLIAQAIVQAPATIFIPAGVRHNTNIAEATGFVIATAGTAAYASSLVHTGIAETAR